jgi:transposase, IS30 family
MVAVLNSAPMKRMPKPGSRLCGRNPAFLLIHEKLQEMIANKLRLDWSSDQISAWLKTQYPNDQDMRVSHETIYCSLFIQARGVLKRAGWASAVQAPHPPLATRSCQRTVAWSNRRGHLHRGRPAEIEDRAVPGHWEGDLLSGSKNSPIVTQWNAIHAWPC